MQGLWFKRRFAPIQAVKVFLDEVTSFNSPSISERTFSESLSTILNILKISHYLQPYRYNHLFIMKELRCLYWQFCVPFYFIRFIISSREISVLIDSVSVYSIIKENIMYFSVKEIFMYIFYSRFNFSLEF